MPLATLGCTVDANGISAPSYADILQSLRESAQQIFGSDVYLEADSQDGQLLALFASSINDANNAMIAAYQQFSPSFAQGAGLSSVVKINGIARRVATNSSAVGNVVGQAGTVIIGGVVQDENGNLWSLPASVTIPGGGSIAVTVIANDTGAIVAPAGTINKIATPTFGWQSFTSTVDADIGDPVETDNELRQRQTASTALGALTPLSSMYGALANLAGVDRLKVYENSTNVTDGDGIPAHNISVVIEGGDVQEIAETIGQRKTPGAGTYGTTSENYMDPNTGILYTINFFELDTDSIQVEVTGNIIAGYNSNIQAAIKQAVADFINGLQIGQDVQYSRMYLPAYLNGSVDGTTYEITDLQIGINGGGTGTADIPIAFNHAAVCDPAVDVTVTIT